MKKIAFLGFASTLLLASVGHADEAFTLDKPSVSGHLLFGAGDKTGDINPYGFGIGARGGYTLDQGIYIGGLLDYFFGGSNGPASLSTWLIQAEGGYDFGITPTIVIRPKLGLGATTGHGKVCGFGNCYSDSNTDFSLALGAEAIFDVGPVYVAPELRYNIVFSDGDWNAFVLGVGVGKAF